MKPLVSNIRFIVQPLAKGSHAFLDEEEKFQERLLRLSDSTFSTYSNNLPPSLRTLQERVIEDCAVGPRHLAFLLEDGSVCRISYRATTKPTVNEKASDESIKDKNYSKSGSRSSKVMRTSSSRAAWSNMDFLGVGGSGSWSRWGNRIGVIRSSASSGGTTTTSSGSTSARKTTRGSSNANSGDSLSGSGIRLIRAGQVRSRNLPILTGSQRVMVPASHVPEDLINQVQNILQGKSRSVIVRELQRTHLDVNLAVNNLLSRDDEDNDDIDDGVGDYIPGEELMSLLDGGMPPGDHPRVVIDADAMLPEDLLGYTFSSRASSSSQRRSGADDRDDADDSFSRYASSHWAESSKSSDGKHQSKAVSESGIELGESLEWWLENEEIVKFKLIGAMHSELVAVDSNGVLRQWKWASPEPYHTESYHPRSLFLKLEKEKISMLSSSLMQASVVTEEGSIATWTDESVASHTTSLHLPCFVSEPLKHDRPKSLHVCSLFSAVLTEQGKIHWWGVLPFSQRKKIIEKSQASLQQNVDKESGAKEEITVGSQVCLRSFPIYHVGAIAINVSSGYPKVGKLLQSVWNLDKKCPFEILSSDKEIEDSQFENEGLPPMQCIEPITETNDSEPTSLKKWDTVIDNSKPVSPPVDGSVKSRKRKRSASQDDEHDDGKREEMWDLKDAIFIEDVHTIPTGRVTKVDENIVAVYFSSDDQSNATETNAKCVVEIPNSCRLLHKNDVVVLKASAPKVLDCIQTTPRKLQCDPHMQLHCISVAENGINAIVNKNGGKLSYVHFSINSGKILSQRPFPTKPDSFFYNKENNTTVKTTKTTGYCKLLNCSQNSPTLLQDCNSMLYPLLADENGGIRDPIWADIPPLFASAMGTFLDERRGRSTITVLAFQTQVLMPLIMGRDSKGFETLINSVNSNQDASWTKVFFQSLCDERCDGQRNILHMCVEMSIPSTNKEQKEDEKLKAEKNKQNFLPKPSPSSVKPPSLPKSRPFVSSEPEPTEGNPPSFMTEGERMNAVTAIANAISCAKAPRTTEEAPTQRQPPSSSSTTTSNVLHPGASSSSVDANNTSRSGNESQNKASSPPGSPILTWPPDFAHYWKNMTSGADDYAEEEGINLSLNNGGEKKKNWTPPSNPDSWTEIGSCGKERGTRADALEILSLLCKTKCMKPYLKKLLVHKDTSGYTPFMFAVAHRAYPAALLLFKAAINMVMDSGDEKKENSKENIESSSNLGIFLDLAEQKELLSMIYPPDSDADDNPLYMLCCNDNCSFTWTGALHINQDIFECLTCGLTETLCCCTECARICHKGHDCKLKRTNPTAYCDCWEKCACKSLVEGSREDRMALLRMLLHTTKLYDKYNSSGQHIIHFLVKTVARQSEEQRQYRPPGRTARMSVSTIRSQISRIVAKSAPTSGEQDVPEHDLRPPQFCREALLQMLSDWEAVRSLIYSGCKDRRDSLSMSSRLDAKEHSSFINLLPEDEELLSSQTGTVRLDIFTYTIIAKCANNEYLDRLLETLIHTVQVNKHRDQGDGIAMARRFIRSVIRVFVVLTAQCTPDKLAAKMSLYNQSALAKCKRAFMALITISVEELCETAESLIAPVRMGVVKPTTPYSLATCNADLVYDSTVVFSRLPFPPRSNYSDDDEPDKQRKTSKKVRKKSKYLPKSKRFRSRHVRSNRSQGSEVRSQEHGNDDDSDHPTTSQDTQPIDEDGLATNLNNLFQDTDDQVDGRNDENDVVEEESDMDLTDIELIAPDSESESVDTYFSTQSGDAQSRDQDMQHDNEETAPDEQIGKQDDEDTDSDGWQDEVNLERRSTREQRNQARQTPHTMQWAMGTSSMVPIKGSGASNNGRQASGLNSSSNSGLVYVDSRSLRRNEPSLENVYLGNVLDRHHFGNKTKNVKEGSKTSSSSVTKAQLARLFATCVREIVHLLSTLQKGNYLSGTTLNTVLEVSFQDAADLRAYTQQFMEQTWKWLLTIIEATECQLRYGQVLSMASSPSHSAHPHYKGATSRRTRESSRHLSNASLTEDSAARQDFLSYILSLMRSHSDEHSDLLPMVDISALKHIAYVLDVYVYYLRALSNKDGVEDKQHPTRSHSITLDIGYDNSENEDDEEDYASYPDDLYSVAVQPEPTKSSLDDDLNVHSHPQSSFFRRSESMTFLGCSDPNNFDVPLPVALPLAEKPHLLQPTSRKEELFGRSRISSSNTSVHLASMSVSKRTTPSVTSKRSSGPTTSTDENKVSKSRLTILKALLAKKSSDPPVEASTLYSTLDLSSSALQAEDLTIQSSDGVKSEKMDVDIIPPTSFASSTKDTAQPEQPVSSSDQESPIKSITDDVKPNTSSPGQQKTEVTSYPDDVAMETPTPGVTVTVATANEEENVNPKDSKLSSKPHSEDMVKEVHSVQSVLGRCRLTLELFSRMFLDNVGAEPKSILYELGGFEVRESKFRKEMEKLRASQSVDLHLNVERSRDQLIFQSFKQLNQHYKQRAGSSQQPMAVGKVKVIFDNEPGEGTGVARSFYTAICSALLSSERLPPLDGVLPESSSSTNRKSSSSTHLSLVARIYRREREREERANRGSSSSSGSNRNINLRSFLTARYRELATGERGRTYAPLTAQAAPYVKRSGRGQSGQSSMDRNKHAIGDKLYPKVATIQQTWVSKITGMLLELPAYELLLLLRSERSLHQRVAEAYDLLLSSGYTEGEDQTRADSNSSSERTETPSANESTASDSIPLEDSSKKNSDENTSRSSETEQEDVSMNDTSDGGPPMFYQPGKRGIYAPTSWGGASDLRLNAYRNVGRMMGLCLLQNELCPLPLCRHVLKVILGRKVHWHDLAFFDPTLYESLRQLIADAEVDDGEMLDILQLTFVVDLQNEEGGIQAELVPDGASILVTKDNILDYVRRYALHRMVGCCKKHLDKLRQGVYDVLPRSSIQSLTAEDLRLLLNGCGHVHVHSLISYTLFNDESGKTGTSSEKLTQFKRWFWGVVDKMSNLERQDLLYFWTGSPALPASEDGFQPMPSITIRPPDDQHLPTANTCISRLYVPLYSTKVILKQKLAIAIKTKNFGFV